MTRMLEALRRGDGQGESEPPSAEPNEAPRLQVVSEPEPVEDMPYIEVGGRGKLIEASPEVLRAGPPAPPAGGSQPAGAAARERPPVEFIGLGASAGAIGVTSVSPPAVRSPSFAARGPMTVAFQPCRTAPAAPVAPAARVAAELITYHQSEHPVSQQYRALLGQVAPAASESGGHVLLLTCLAPAAGVTTALLNLAVVACRAEGRSVAVVDVNWQQPDVAARLGLPPAPGLQEVLSGTASLEQALRPTAQEHLHVLTAGAQAARAAVVGEALRWVVGWLRQRFDLVFLDGPVWDESAEMATLVSACGEVLLVLHGEDAERPAVRAASRAIARMGGHLGGLIVTG